VSGPERFSASGVAPDDGSAAIGLIAGTATIKLVTPDVRAPSRSWSLSFDPQQTIGDRLGEYDFRTVAQASPTFYFREICLVAALGLHRLDVQHASFTKILATAIARLYFAALHVYLRAPFARPRVRAREIPAGAVRSACPCSAKRRAIVVLRRQWIIIQRG
jgi:hypothetical protein